MQSNKSYIHNLLRKSEKYTGTDMVYLASGGFWVGLGRVVATLAGMALAVAYANLLPQTTYGTYKYVLSLLSLLTITTLPDLNTALIRSVARGYEGSVIPVLKTRMKWGAYGSIVALVIGIYYLSAGDLTLSVAFLISAGFLPFMDTTSVYASYLEGKKEFKKSTSYGIALEIITTVAVVITLLLTSNIILLLFVYYITHTLTRALFLWMNLKGREMEQKKDPQVLSYGKHLSLMGVIGTVASQIDSLLAWHILGATSLAVYAFAIAPITHASKLLRSINPVAFPKFTKGSSKILKQTLPEKVWKYTALTSIGVLLYVICAPLLFNLFFPQYMDAVPFSQIYALSLIFTPASMFGTTLVARAQKKSLYIVRVTSHVLKIALMVLLIPFWGLWGAIIGLLIVTVITNGMSYYYFHQMSEEEKV